MHNSSPALQKNDKGVTADWVKILQSQKSNQKLGPKLLECHHLKIIRKEIFTWPTYRWTISLPSSLRQTAYVKGWMWQWLVVHVCMYVFMDINIVHCLCPKIPPKCDYQICMYSMYVCLCTGWIWHSLGEAYSRHIYCCCCTFEQDCIVNMVFTFPRENLWPSTVHIDMAQLSGEYLHKCNHNYDYDDVVDLHHHHQQCKWTWPSY